MNAIDAQRCDDARHLIQAELDRSLRLSESARLHHHLDACSACQGYRAELARIQALLQQAGHAHGHPPQGVPDLAYGVTRRLRREQPRRMLFSLAQATAQLGGLALVAVLAMNSADWSIRPTSVTPAPDVSEAFDAGAPRVTGQGVVEPMRIPESEFDDEAAEAVRPVEADRTPTQAVQPGGLLPD